MSWKSVTGTSLDREAASTPTTSVGSSSPSRSGGIDEAQSVEPNGVEERQKSPSSHCPHAQAAVRCEQHRLVELDAVLTQADSDELYEIWNTYQDDLSWPWYDKKPDFSNADYFTFRRLAQKVVDAMAAEFGPLALDQATISRTNHHGHPPHADNVQFDSVWWGGRQIKQKDELVAARGGAEVLWKQAKTEYRNYSASIALSEPDQYGGGELEFYDRWGDREPRTKYRRCVGSGVAYCGCHRNIHAVTGVKWGFRLSLLVWTRPVDVPVPEAQKHVCYYRPGTGCSVWLTAADLEQYPLPS